MRRRVFVVVLILTVAFLALYAVGTEAAFDSIDAEAAGAALDVDDEVLTGSTLLGLAMFTTLFLGCVLAVFLTLGAVRGDAERGLLQPLVVRPLGRTALLGGRFAAAAGVCALYVGARLHRRDGDHRRRRRLVAGRPGGPRAGAGGRRDPDRRAVAARLDLPVGDRQRDRGVHGVRRRAWPPACWGRSATRSTSTRSRTWPRSTSWVLPFEALYQGGLDSLTEDVGGTTGVIVQLGPFGGAQEAGPLLWAWSAAYLVAARRGRAEGVCAAGPVSGRFAPIGRRSLSSPVAALACRIACTGCATGAHRLRRSRSVTDGATVGGKVGQQHGGQVEYWAQYGPDQGLRRRRARTRRSTAAAEPGARRGRRRDRRPPARRRSTTTASAPATRTQQGGPGCGEDRRFTTQSVGCGDDGDDATSTLTGDLFCPQEPGLHRGSRRGGHQPRRAHLDGGGISVGGGGPRGIDNTGGFDDLTVRNGSIVRIRHRDRERPNASRNRLLDI